MTNLNDGYTLVPDRKMTDGPWVVDIQRQSDGQTIGRVSYHNWTDILKFAREIIRADREAQTAKLLCQARAGAPGAPMQQDTQIGDGRSSDAEADAAWWRRLREACGA